MSEENSSGFKITDRRLFNADGSLRDDVIIEEEKPVPAPPPPPPPKPAPQFSAADLTGAAVPRPPTPPPPSPPPPPPAYAAQEAAAEPEQTEFTEFLMRIASEAFIYLGMMPHPMTGRPQIDLNAAKEVIDMIVMLQQKTRGNLTPGEARFFEDLLADLKMQFVSMRQR
jgi:hypothetical protein